MRGMNPLRRNHEERFTIPGQGTYRVAVITRSLPIWTGNGARIPTYLVLGVFRWLIGDNRGFYVAVHRQRRLGPPQLLVLDATADRLSANIRANELATRARAGAASKHARLTHAARRDYYRAIDAWFANPDAPKPEALVGQRVPCTCCPQRGGSAAMSRI